MYEKFQQHSINIHHYVAHPHDNRRVARWAKGAMPGEGGGGDEGPVRGCKRAQ